MQIQFPTLPVIVAAARASLAVNWSLNQLLTAEVIGPTVENSTQLRIDGRLLTARTELPLSPGQRLTVQVSQLEPTMTLKIVPPEAGPQATAVARGLARNLPLQATPQQTVRLLDELRTLSGQHAGAGSQSTDIETARLVAPAVLVLRTLPAPAALVDAKALRGVIEQAAMPTESRLVAMLERSQPSAVLDDDLRATLIKVRDTFAPSAVSTGPTALAGAPRPDPAAPAAAGMTAAARPPAATATTVAPQDEAVAVASTLRADGELFELIDHVVARLQSHHLQNAATSAATHAQFLVEIPLQRGGNTEILRFEYERETAPRENDDSPARAQVVISLLMDDGHEFNARVRLHDDVLAIRLGSSDTGFNRELAARQDQLLDGLKAQGLEVAELVVSMLEVDKRPRAAGHPLVDAHV